VDAAAVVAAAYLRIESLSVYEERLLCVFRIALQLFATQPTLP
jgi:hypothetical protein